MAFTAMGTPGHDEAMIRSASTLPVKYAEIANGEASFRAP
jgi:hypothetical protein